MEVNVAFGADGQMLPREIIWENGSTYHIDLVKGVTTAPALRAGGQGDRYTIMINGQERYLWFERSTEEANARIGRWFIEKPAT